MSKKEKPAQGDLESDEFGTCARYNANKIEIVLFCGHSFCENCICKGCMNIETNIE